MGAVAFVVERRLVKALHRKGDETPSPATDLGGDAELTTAPNQIDQQPQR
jgi:hypothetical protein